MNGLKVGGWEVKIIDSRRGEVGMEMNGRGSDGSGSSK